MSKANDPTYLNAAHVLHAFFQPVRSHHGTMIHPNENIPNGIMRSLSCYTDEELNQLRTAAFQFAAACGVTIDERVVA